jgi:beta-phosphoglucomutase
MSSDTIIFLHKYSYSSMILARYCIKITIVPGPMVARSPGVAHSAVFLYSGSGGNMIHGVLFDVDGVLLDSEPFIREAAVAMFAERGVSVKPEIFLQFTGAGEDRFIGGPAEIYGVPYTLDMKDRTYELYGQIVRGRLTPLPGVREFIARCREKGLKLAVATSADLVKLLINLKEIGLEDRTFDTLVNGNDVVRKKPYPDIYLKAASLIGVDPRECLVVEDAVSGIKAGKAAGARCLGLTTSFDAKSLEDAGAEWIAADLSKAPPAVTGW